MSRNRLSPRTIPSTSRQAKRGQAIRCHATIDHTTTTRPTHIHFTLPQPLRLHMLYAQERDTKHITRLSEKLRQGIMDAIPHCEMNGSLEARYPGNLNISFGFVEGESLLMALKVRGLS